MVDLLAGLLYLACIASFVMGEPALGVLVGAAALAVFLFGESILPWSE
jgi:hypothetical protein